MKKMFAIVLAFTTFSFSSYAYEGYASKGYLGDFGQETVLCQINAYENQVSIADAMNMTSNSNSDCSELFFSGYNEPGSGSKFVVVYNPTGNSINLSGYKITKFVNGDDFNEGVDYALSGTIASYGVHQVGNGSSGTNIGGGASWNGDDAIALYNGTTMIDLIGEVGYDPGSSWSSGGVSTANKTLRRKSTIKKGVTTNPTTFNPSLEWEVVSLSDVDQHTSDCESSLPACATDTTFTFSDCDSTQFNGVYYTANTTITDTLTNAAGCDSLIYNQIIVHPSYSVSESENGVDSLIFNGTTYYTDTTVVDTLASIFGCDSVISTSIEVYISPNPCTELFITEYLEGYSSNRAIEIYNPTASAISLANYSLRKYDGSNTTPNSTIYTSWSTASIPAYGTYTVAHNSAYNTTKNLADATTTNSVLSFSGNDAIGLFKGNALVDIVGSVGTSSNFAQNKTLVRKNNVQLGKLTYDASDWFSLSANNIDSLGMHNSVCEPPSCDVDTTITFSDCDSTQFNGVYYLTNTTISDTFPLGGGCDSIVINEIIVHPSYTITDSKSGSDSVIVHGTTYFTDTTAVDTLSSFLGCDSVVTTNVTVILPAPDCSEIFISEYAEKGNTKAIELYNPTSFAIDLNDYVLKKHNSGSQSNTNSLNLKGTINAHDVYLISYNQAPSAVQTAADTVTSSSAMTFNGNDPVGIYKNNILVDIVGEIGNSSDHIEDVTLQRKSAIKIGALIYSVGDWNSLGANFTDSLGNHTSECATAVSPCAAVDTTLTVASCESYIYGSTTFMNDTIYVDSLLSIAGCDSVVTLNLTINTGSSDTMNVSTCDASYTFGGMNITTAGMYADTNSNVNGCDSIEVLNIVFNTGSSDTMNVSTCDASYSFGGMNITTAGMYADTNSNINGCDSIEVLNIVFNTGSSDTMNVSTCDASYSFGGMNITTAGMYADTNSNINGCDSIEVLNIVFNTGSSDTMNVSTCDASYSFGGMNITTSGMYADTNSNINGCDSIEVLNIVFNTGSSDTMNIATCDASYSFAGMNITTSGMYADTNSNVNGCDSIEVLNIVFNTGSTSTTNITTCDASYSFGGMTLTTSGMYADTNSNVNGCDSIEVLNIVFNTPTSASSTVETCDPVFNFAGQVFTSSTIFVDTLTAFNGCDSVHTYNIVLHPKVYGDTLDIATCDFPYTHNGLQYSTAGLNQITTTSTVTGCDSIYYLDIVFNETHDTVITVSDICESYYVFNQDTLTASGVHVFNFASVAGCDSVVNLHLSFAPDLTPQILVNQFVLSVPNTYNTYQWYSCTTNQPIPGAVGNSFAPTVDGDYYLIVESAYGCTHQSECVEFRGISVEEYLFANITMYPNPTTGKIYMTFSQEFDYQILNKVRVMNSLGQAIFESSEITSNKEINLSDFQNGIYFVEFSSVYGNKIQKKIIKQ